MNIRTKLFLTLLVVNITLLVLLAVILEMEVNHHFGLLMSQEMNLISPSMSQSMQFHFGQALRQSLIWTVLSFIAITMAIAIFVSKRFTRRIQLMQRQAKQIANGQWDATLPVEGRDELSSLSHTLNYLSEELGKQQELRKHLMQDIAHELRTPLTTLKSHIEAFLDGVWTPNPQRLQSCLEEIERFQSLVKDVETLYQADAFEPKEKQRLDLRRVVRTVSELFESRCANVGIVLTLKEEDTEVWLLADEESLARIVWNLLDNAVKFTPEQGNIHLVVASANGESFLQVEDSGIGIPEEERGNIFERFYRVEKSRDRRKGGSGLGLAIVKRLVSLSEGTIEVSSQLKKGTTFTIRWPSVQSETLGQGQVT